MIPLKRITLRSNIVYENIQLLSDEEQQKQGITRYLTEGQIAFKCKDGLIISSAFHVILIQISTHQKKLATDKCNRAARLTLSGDNVYDKLCVLNKKQHQEYNIPLIFRPPMEQLVFACNDGMYIANSFHVLQIIPWCYFYSKLFLNTGGINDQPREAIE